MTGRVMMRNPTHRVWSGSFILDRGSNLVFDIDTDGVVVDQHAAKDAGQGNQSRGQQCEANRPGQQVDGVQVTPQPIERSQRQHHDGEDGVAPAEDKVAYPPERDQIDLVSLRRVRNLILGWCHAILAVMMLSLASLNWLWRYLNPVDLLPWAVGLTLLTAGLVTLAGILGGMLVYDHAVGVDIEDKIRAAIEDE